MPNNITFTCDADGCNNKKTVTANYYAKHKNHYCGYVCSYASRKKIVLKLNESCRKCKKPLTDKDMYESTNGLSSYCKECRNTKTTNKIKNCHIEREKFVIKFNKRVWK